MSRCGQQGSPEELRGVRPLHRPKEAEEDADAFNELYYQHAIAKAIIFRTVEKLVSAQPWYEGGYRAQIVAYAIAKLAHAVEVAGRAVDLDRIWRDQGVSESMEAALVDAVRAAHGVLTTPAIRN